jgi:hypothetical protein
MGERRRDPDLAPWTDQRVWEAVDAWRWRPPGATQVLVDGIELDVTPGSYALTFAYGFPVVSPYGVDAVLDHLETRVKELGGTGVRLRVMPPTAPAELGMRLERRGYRQVEEAEALVWELRRSDGSVQLPRFAMTPGINVREVATDAEYDAFQALQGSIFGDPPPPANARAKFIAEFHRTLREEGHSDRFLVSEGSLPIGRGGLEIVDGVARLWGSGVLPQHRGRGGYGALVLARCESAVQRGAEIALVTARVGTSGPILKRRGFRLVGAVRQFEARW